MIDAAVAGERGLHHDLTARLTADDEIDRGQYPDGELHRGEHGHGTGTAKTAEHREAWTCD